MKKAIPVLILALSVVVAAILLSFGIIMPKMNDSAAGYLAVTAILVATLVSAARIVKRRHFAAK